MGGNAKGRRRRFGAARQLPSGRWQARYATSDGVGRLAPHTFPRKGDAERWLIALEAEILRGDWLDPAACRTPFGPYAEAWVRERDLSETTRERYDGLLRTHLLPTFGAWPVGDVKEPDVRRWRHDELSEGAGTPTIAKAYRLLRAILYTAVDDGLIRRNPAASRVPVTTRARSVRCSASRRCSPSPLRCRSGIARWCCWRRSQACASASWRRYVEATSTWPPAWCTYGSRRPS